jgi:hypothetical protein
MPRRKLRIVRETPPILGAPKSTNAERMVFAILIPDWNSLDSVRHVHSELEAVALVFFALLVLFDVLAHLSKDERKEKLLEKVGLGFFAVAVLAEIVAYPYGRRNDTLSEQIIGSLDAKSREASTNASNALIKSSEAETKADGASTLAGDALTKAGKAQESLGKAEDEANRGEEAASNALTLARGARQEADSFEADIKAAKQQATDAESHLADALQRAANAERETAELKARAAPRRLDPKQQASIASKLSSLAGKRADITMYPVTYEGAALAEQIKAALLGARLNADFFPAQAGWGGVTSGVMVMPNSSDESGAVADAIVEALQAEGVVTFKSSQLIPGCEVMGPTYDHNKDPYCARVLIVVGNHP